MKTKSNDKNGCWACSLASQAPPDTGLADAIVFGLAFGHKYSELPHLCPKHTMMAGEIDTAHTLMLGDGAAS
jgi:hypothetical protein